MSRSSFDYARQQRSTVTTIKRKKKFGQSPFRAFSVPVKAERTTITHIETPDKPSITQRLIHGVIGICLVAVLCSIFLNKYPSEIKDVVITNGYLLILVPFCGALYCLCYAFISKTANATLFALLGTILLFLKLQAVIFKISLILPLFAIFAIIGMFYNRKSKA